MTSNTGFICLVLGILLRTSCLSGSVVPLNYTPSPSLVLEEKKPDKQNIKKIESASLIMATPQTQIININLLQNPFMNVCLYQLCIFSINRHIVCVLFGYLFFTLNTV